jgi:hypothetical protein
VKDNPRRCPELLCYAPLGLRRNPNRHACLKNMNFRHPKFYLKKRLPGGTTRWSDKRSLSADKLGLSHQSVSQFVVRALAIPGKG